MAVTKYLLVNDNLSLADIADTIDKGLKVAMQANGLPVRPVFGDSPADIRQQSLADGMPADYPGRVVEVTFHDLNDPTTN